MGTNSNQHVCPVEFAGSLDNRLRRWLQNPKTLLSPYINPGMRVLDMGCGPGFFTIEMAWLTGKEGQVVAADLQKGMLERIAKKINGTELSNQITLHLCQQDSIGLPGKFDFIFAFYMVHEVSDHTSFFKELASLLKPGGKLLIIEPKFHVPEKSFTKTIGILTSCGFSVIKERSTLVNREVLVTFFPVGDQNEGKAGKDTLKTTLSGNRK